MSSDRYPRLIKILLVEDSPTDVLMIRAVLEQEHGQMPNRLHVVEDGVEALAFLRQCRAEANARPDLILLDLNLPRKNGREVLAEIKDDDQLKVIPVVILTSSQAEDDILKAYGLHANCYITKPMDFDDFALAVRTFEHFWLSVVTLPPR